jgi:hypothetical protein
MQRILKKSIAYVCHTDIQSPQNILPHFLQLITHNPIPDNLVPSRDDKHSHWPLPSSMLNLFCVKADAGNEPRRYTLCTHVYSTYRPPQEQVETSYTVKKGFPPRESLVSDIPVGDRNVANFCFDSVARHC